MDSIWLPFGWMYRAWVAVRSNPCTIEMVYRQFEPSEEYIRIRNDSSQPVQLFDVNFLWKPKGSRKFSELHSPLVWILSERTQSALAPGHSFEHPIDSHELGIECSHVKVVVEHNRSNKPSQKKFKLRGPRG